MFYGAAWAAGATARGGALLAAGAEGLAARGIAALASRAAPGALGQIQAAGRMVGRLGLSQTRAASLLTNALGRMGYEIGDDQMINGVRYLISATSNSQGVSHALGIATNGAVTNAKVRFVQGAYQLIP
ncbi:MAG: hypothetical protein M3P51_14245 [Chloroflexota bacterium]|nr:hypothetical protein [Chloroflexota bacterium]